MAFQFNEDRQGACHPRQLRHLADRVAWPTADGGLLEGAQDTLDAEVIAIAVGGFFDLSRPMAVVGYGDGELPRLVGEAYGVVGVGGTGAVTLPISGEAHGEADGDVELMLLLLAA